MARPPAGRRAKNAETLFEAFLLHYTWGPRFTTRENKLWVFDKRAYGGGTRGPYELTRLPDPRRGTRPRAATADVLPAARAHGIKLALVKIMIGEINAAVTTPARPKDSIAGRGAESRGVAGFRI